MNRDQSEALYWNSFTCVDFRSATMRLLETLRRLGVPDTDDGVPPQVQQNYSDASKSLSLPDCKPLFAIILRKG